MGEPNRVFQDQKDIKFRSHGRARDSEFDAEVWSDLVIDLSNFSRKKFNDDQSPRFRWIQKMIADPRHDMDLQAEILKGKSRDQAWICRIQHRHDIQIHRVPLGASSLVLVPID